jgi:hypothetical protein
MLTDAARDNTAKMNGLLLLTIPVRFISKHPLNAIVQNINYRRGLL